jgi:hypothetical protein
MTSNLKELVKNLIDEIEKEDLEIEEATTTGDIAGYNTPSAFKKSDGTDTDDTNDISFIDKINQATGYTRVNENRWLALKQEDGTPTQKLGKGISNIRKQLSEIETFLNWYSKIKKESGLNSDQYWKRTQRNLFKIRERLNNIATSITKL